MNYDKVPELNDEPPPPAGRGRWLAGLVAVAAVAGGLALWQLAGPKNTFVAPPVEQKQLKAKIAYLEERLQILTANLAKLDANGPVEAERELIEEAVTRQVELIRLRPGAGPEDEQRLTVWQTTLSNTNARAWGRQSLELEAASAELFRQKQAPAAVEKLKEALRLQREINGSLAGLALKNPGREARLELGAERFEAEPLQAEAGQLLAQAREAVQAGRWTEALARFGRGRDIQLKLNRDYARTRFADLPAVGRIEAEMAALSDAKAHDQLEALGQQAAAAAAAQKPDEAERLWAAAADRQKIINEQFPQSRFVSKERLEQIEVERQTVRARAMLEEAGDLSRRATEHLRQRKLLQAQLLIGQALERLEAGVAQQPKARGVDEGLRQRLSFLNLRQADLGQIQDRTYDLLLPLPGHEQFALLKTEVTQELYARVMDANPSRNPGPALPVDSLTYAEAEEFCRRLGWIMGATVRLPTAPEFRAAVGDATVTSANAWGIENSPGKSQPAGEKPANLRGFHDLLGNLAEWLGTEAGDRAMLAGGSFTESRAQLKAQPLRPALKTERARTNGLRVVVELDGSPRSPAAELFDQRELGRLERHDGQPALPHQPDVLQGHGGFDLSEGDGRLQRRGGGQLHGDPAWFIGGRIGKGGLGHTGEADHAPGVAAVIEQHLVARLHGLEVEAGRVVADTGPRGATLASEVVPRIGFGFGFHQPVLRCHREGCLVGCGHERA